MYATKKSDLKSFKCNTKSVCRIEGNSSNAYLLRDRAIEEFLVGVEPKYDASLLKLRSQNIDPECIGVISGFASFVACCAPAAIRIHMAPLKNLVESEALILDRQGLLPRSPAILGNRTVAELLTDGAIQVDIDQKFPQAVGISTILGRTSLLGNSPWEILQNDNPNDPFFTSDYPIALEASTPRLANWIVPLAPDLAIRVRPDVNLARSAPDLSFKRFSYRYRSLPRSEVIEINRLSSDVRRTWSFIATMLFGSQISLVKTDTIGSRASRNVSLRNVASSM